MFAQYIVRVVFVGSLVIGLFVLPGVAFGDELGGAIDPPPMRGGPLLAIPVIGTLITAAMWIGIGAAVIEWLVKPLVAVIP
jgi:hypothetical protein